MGDEGYRVNQGEGKVAPFQSEGESDGAVPYSAMRNERVSLYKGRVT